MPARLPFSLSSTWARASSWRISVDVCDASSWTSSLVLVSPVVAIALRLSVARARQTGAGAGSSPGRSRFRTARLGITVSHHSDGGGGPAPDGSEHRRGVATPDGGSDGSDRTHARRPRAAGRDPAVAARAQARAAPAPDHPPRRSHALIEDSAR